MGGSIRKRDFLAAGAGLGLCLATSAAFGQAPPPTPRPSIPHRKAKTTVLFQAPGLYPNALAVAPEGLWIGQQKGDLGGSPDEAAWLVDWNGKLLKTVMTPSRNTSGMAFGDGCIWMGANAAPEGIFQVDMNSRLLSHRQIPLSLDPTNGGGSHGAQWHEGKLWIVANSQRVLMRIDPKSWTPEAVIPIYFNQQMSRWHDMTFDADGNIYQVTGNDSTGFHDGTPGLVKYDGKTGQVLEIVDLLPGSCDPHGLEFHDGALISCDAGSHPGWKMKDSPFTGAIFQIDLI